MGGPAQEGPGRAVLGLFLDQYVQGLADLLSARWVISSSARPANSSTRRATSASSRWPGSDAASVPSSSE